LSRNVVATLAAFALTAALLFATGRENYPNLHTVLDACVFLVSSLLALLLREMAQRIRKPFLGCIAVSFAVTSLFELIHVLVVIEWSGRLDVIAEAAEYLRPSTWPPAAYVLPVGIGACIWSIKRGRSGVKALSVILTLLGLALLGIFYLLPRYAPPTVFGITRPYLALLPLLWAAVAWLCWHERESDRTLPMLALSSVVLILAHISMVYSQAPHDTPAMVAHLGKLAGYLTLVLMLMDMASRDMRAVFETEHRFRGLLEAAPDAIVIVDASGAILLINEQTEKLFGYRRDEIYGRKVETLMPERFRMLHPSERGRYYAAPRPRQMGEGLDLMGLRSDGTEFPVEISLSPLNTPEGMLVISSIRDITARMRDAKRLAEHAANLEAANKELEGFSYTVAHDLRAPLRHIDGFIGLLQQESGASLNERSQYYVSTVSNAAKRMGNLIDALLVFSRLGRADFNKSRVNLEQLVKEAMQDIAPQLDGRRIEWKIGALPEVRGDRIMLRQVLVNLLANAVKFTRTRSEAEIEVGASVNGEGVDVFVRDNGVGFDPRYTHKLFGVFHRLHSADEFEGIGIGLASVRRLIERHGGTTWATGEIDKGSTFYFSLPKDG
jgi:PAS domain S-box-containing protein